MYRYTTTQKVDFVSSVIKKNITSSTVLISVLFWTVGLQKLYSNKHE